MKKLIFSALFILGLSGVAFAEDGVLDNKIIFGQTAAIDGPASALGTGMRDGLLAAFKEVNDAGGVNGKTLELVTLNDGYEPDKAVENTRALINDKKAFAVVGAVGTPTTKAIEPITTEAKVPLIGPFTGAEFLRNPYKRYVVNVRGSYFQETEAWIKHLTEDLGAKNIAILYQDDSFGRAGLAGVKKALDKRGMELAGEGTYQRNTTAVKSALISIKKANPDAVVMVGAYKPIAEFVRNAKKLGMDLPMVTISFVGSKALAQELGADGEGVVITQVVPFPFDESNSLVKEYKGALKAYDSSLETGFVSLEGYMVGRLVVDTLKNMSGNITRETFLDAVFAKGTYDLGGTTLKYGAEDNQGMDKVFLSIINADGSFKSVDKLN